MIMSNRLISNRDSQNFDGNGSKIVSIIVGCTVVTVTAALSICGVKSVVANIDKISQDSIVLAQQMTNDKITHKASEDLANMRNKWSSNQVDWMSKNHITYNENGLPVDIKGNVVDDPTTKIDETKIVSDRHDKDVTNNATSTVIDDSNNNNSVSDVITDTKPDIDPVDWAEGKSWVEISEDGRYYYTVKKGDVLSSIASMSGFTLQSLIDYNDISNSNVITIGEKIYFPTDGPMTNVESNLGLG